MLSFFFNTLFNIYILNSITRKKKKKKDANITAINILKIIAANILNYLPFTSFLLCCCTFMFAEY